MLTIARRLIGLAGTAVFALGCSSAAELASDDDAWRGTVTEEGSVTTVVNTAGSVWGGTATLVEEAAIGVMEGPDEYMLGRINGLWATDREIIVLDSQVPSVRVYDYDGNHIRQLGRPGQGPGEYGRPRFVGGDDQGRIFVADYDTRRIQLFSIEGEDLGSWHMGNVFCCIVPMVVTADGTAYLQALEWAPDTGRPLEVIQAHGPDGAFGGVLRPPEFDVPVHKIEFQGRRMPVHYAPAVKWTLTRDAATIAGANHEYKFRVTRADGDVIEIEKAYEPVPLEGEERDWYRRYTMASLRRGEPGWTWDGAEMPAVKPAFDRFIPTQDGNIWVVRPGPGHRLPECNPDADVDDHRAFQEVSCFRDVEIVDVFGPDGRFLGDIAVPGKVNLRFAHPWAKGDTVIASAYDETGLIQVIRYRLVLPGVN